jgi:hypothetical protein
VHEKIDGVAPGTIVELTDEEYEVYAPIATQRGKPLAPHIATELMQLVRPVLTATSKRPEPNPTNEQGTGKSQ